MDIDQTLLDAVCAVRRAHIAHNPDHRELHRRNAIVMATALKEAKNLMAGSDALSVVEEVMHESIFDSVTKYLATFIPLHQRDDLLDPFQNAACNVDADDGTFGDVAYFERLDAAIAEFKSEYAILFDD